VSQHVQLGARLTHSTAGDDHSDISARVSLDTTCSIPELAWCRVGTADTRRARTLDCLLAETVADGAVSNQCFRGPGLPRQEPKIRIQQTRSVIRRRDCCWGWSSSRLRPLPCEPRVAGLSATRGVSLRTRHCGIACGDDGLGAKHGPRADGCGAGVGCSWPGLHRKAFSRSRVPAKKARAGGLLRVRPTTAGQASPPSPAPSPLSPSTSR
jgi:hypothetical protein